MATLNKLMLIGRLTDNPEEPRTLPNSGTRVIRFRFAVGRSRKNEQGGWDKDPNQLYIDCEAFSRPDTKRDLVSLIQQYARKGDPMYLEGRLRTDEWTDKQTNQKRSKHVMVVEGVEFLGARATDEGGGEAPARASRPGGGSYNSGGRPAGRPGSGYSDPMDNDEPGRGGGGNEGGDDIPF